MLTPQEVEERVFPKAKKVGYDMQDVDNFLDQVTTDYSELYKENATLRRRMKVLADKITEYQETEGLMRSTLRAAQKMADQIVEDAKAKQEKMLSETEAEVKARTKNAVAQVTAAENKLRAAKASVSDFTAQVLELIDHEREFLENLPETDMPEEEEAEPEEDFDQRIESMDRIFRGDDEKPAADFDNAGFGDDKGFENTEYAEEEPAADFSEPDPYADDEPIDDEEEEPDEDLQPRVSRRIVDDDADEAPTRRIDLSELRFGKNYEIN